MSHSVTPVAKDWRVIYFPPGNVATGRMAVDSQENVYVTGSIQVAGDKKDLFLVKFDSSGRLLWERYFDGPAHGDDGGEDVACDAEGNILVAGYAGEFLSSSALLLKYAPSGDLIWTARDDFHSERPDSNLRLVLGTDGRVFTVGGVPQIAAFDSLVARSYDPVSGSLLWRTPVGPGLTGTKWPDDLDLDADGNVIVSIINVSGDVFSPHVSKLDRNGKPLWTRGPFSDLATSAQIETSPNGELYLVTYGSLWSLDSEGQVRWERHGTGGDRALTSGGTKGGCTVVSKLGWEPVIGLALAHYGANGDLQWNAFIPTHSTNRWSSGYFVASQGGTLTVLIGTSIHTVLEDGYKLERKADSYYSSDIYYWRRTQAIWGTSSLFGLSQTEMLGPTRTEVPVIIKQHLDPVSPRPVFLPPASKIEANAGTEVHLEVKRPVGATPSNPRIQWWKDATILEGRTNSVLLIPKVGPSDSGFYWVETTGLANERWALPATQLDVLFAPIVTQEPADSETILGACPAFRVGIEGSSPLKIQWYHNGSPVAGATNLYFPVQKAVEADAGIYQAVVSNEFGVAKSREARLSINPGAEVVWMNRFDPGEVAYSAKIQFDSENNLVLLGEATFEGNGVWLVWKVDGQGKLLWRQARPSPPGRQFSFHPPGLALNRSNGIFVCGLDRRDGMSAVISHLSPEGNLVWETVLDNCSQSRSFWDELYAFALDDGGLAVWGTLRDGLETYLARIAKDGRLEWVRKEPSGGRGMTLFFNLSEGREGQILLGTEHGKNRPFDGFLSATLHIESFSRDGISEWIWSLPVSGRTILNRIWHRNMSTSIPGHLSCLLAFHGPHFPDEWLGLGFDSQGQLAWANSQQTHNPKGSWPSLDFDSQNNGLLATGREVVRVDAFGRFLGSTEKLAGDRLTNFNGGLLMSFGAEGAFVEYSTGFNDGLNTAIRRFSFHDNRTWLAPLGLFDGARIEEIDVSSRGEVGFVAHGLETDDERPNTFYGVIAETRDARRPSIVRHFPPQIVAVGQPLKLQIEVSGEKPLTHLWMRDGKILPVSSSNVLEFASVSLVDSGHYSLMVSNRFGSTRSAGAAIWIGAPPGFAEAPSMVDAVAFGSTQLLRTASGTQPMLYQWLFNNATLPGMTNATLSLSSLALTHAGAYALRARNPWGESTSAPIVLRVLRSSAETQEALRYTLESISVVSGGITGLPGRQVTLRVQPVNPDGFRGRIQFLEEGVPRATVSISPFQAAFSLSENLGSRQIVARSIDEGGAVQSSVELTLLSGEPLNILVQPPRKIAVAPGNPTEMAIIVSMPLPGTYQWRLNGVNISGETSVTLNRSTTGLSQSGTYDVIVSNPLGSVASEPCRVVVDATALPVSDVFADRPLLTTTTGAARASTTGATREPAEPSHARSTGGRSVWLAWRAPTDGIVSFETSGSDFDTLLAVYEGVALGSLTPVASDDDGAGFHCSRVRFSARQGTTYNVVIDGFGAASGDAVLQWSLLPTSSDLPRIESAPSSTSVAPGQTARFDVQARGLGPLRYQWFLDFLPVPGANNASLVIPNASLSNVGSYIVRITNPQNQFMESAPVNLELAADPKGLSFDKLGDLIGGLTKVAAPQSVGARFGSHFISVSIGTIGNRIMSNSDSTTEIGEPVHSGVLGGASRWQAIVAESDGDLMIDTAGSDMPTVLAVYTGSSLSDLQRVASGAKPVNSSDRARVVFVAKKGVAYLVVVDGLAGATGLINLTWQFGIPPVVQGIGPQLVRAALGQGVQLAATVRGNPRPSLQWRWNGLDLPAQTNEVLNLGPYDSSLGGFYSVVARSPLGDVSTSIAAVNGSPRITLAEPGFSGDGAFQFKILSDLPVSTVIEASTGLATWIPIYTNLIPSTSTQSRVPFSPRETILFLRAREK